MLLHRHPQAEMQGAPSFGQLHHHPRATPLPEQLFAQQPVVYMEKMKLGFDNRWLLPPPLQQNLSSVGCSRAGVGRSSLRVRARVYSHLELELAQLDAGGGSRRFSACFRSFATISDCLPHVLREGAAGAQNSPPARCAPPETDSIARLSAMLTWTNAGPCRAPTRA